MTLAQAIPTRAADEELPTRGELVHALGADLAHFATIATRKELERDPRYLRLRDEIERLLLGFDWDLADPGPRPQPPAGADAPAAGTLRVVAWNVERGKRFGPLLGVLSEHPLLRAADVLLLNEVDLGMGRSENRHVARELARTLGYRYVFANSHLVLAPGDSAERTHGRPNTLAMHGNAVLSRLPVRRFDGVPLPEYTDKFEALEKRLGQKRALLCELELPPHFAGSSGGEAGEPHRAGARAWLAVAAVHLDPFSSSQHRAAQLRLVLDRLARFARGPVLVGGDLNTNTYDLGSRLGLARNLLHKFTRLGFEETVRQYMTPGEIFEWPVFAAFEEASFELHGYNDESRGTIYYDVNDPELVRKTLDYVPTFAWRWLRRRLRPWGGVVPLRVDWFAGRGLWPLRAEVVERPRFRGEPVSDHNPIVVDLALAPTPAP